MEFQTSRITTDNTNCPFEGIATDAAHSHKVGRTQYRGIDLRTGEQIFYKDLGSQTVNIGEFLGVVEAIKYIIENDYKPAVVYTDSFTALTWIKRKKTHSINRNIALKKAELFLQTMAYKVDRIKIIHWDNKKWGETPADFGHKR